jgi:hypothetical protein
MAFEAHARGRWAEAVGHFAEAMKDDALRADLEKLVLYGGARAAAAAAAHAPEEEAAGLRARALAWLAEDFRRRRDLLARIEAARSGAEPERATALERDRERQLDHFAYARRDDENFAALRGRPEFEALFGGN